MKTKPKTTGLRIASFLTAGALASGCASHVTRVTTTPTGAAVFVNGSQICPQTPCVWDGEMGLPRRFRLQVQKPGYEEVNLFVDRELSILWYLAASIAPYVGPVLTNFAYRNQQAISLELTPASTTPVAPPAAPAPAPPAAPAPAPEPPAPPANETAPAPPPGA
jgi:hypothetical protein